MEQQLTEIASVVLAEHDGVIARRHKELQEAFLGHPVSFRPGLVPRHARPISTDTNEPLDLPGTVSMRDFAGL
jgi:hypothetical protein